MMSFVCHAVGARPQFIKLASVLPALQKLYPCRILHTGQHYDKELSGEHFEHLGIPAPDWHLGVGSAPHGAQTGRIMERMEGVLASDRPDAVIVYGDTNSTLAAALTAAKLNIPVFHVEAGLRSYDSSTPEEINRVVADRLSSLLFCPSGTAVRNLRHEGLTEGIHLVGDVMLDMLLRAVGGDITRLRKSSIEVQTTMPARTEVLRSRGYYLATLHRAENVDNEYRLTRILAALDKLPMPVVFPVHPRTANAIDSIPKGVASDQLLLTEPVGYMKMLELEANSRAVYTDSGGVQKEAYHLRVPCVTLREATEWEETIQHGANVLVGDDQENILGAADRTFPESVPTDTYGDGKASDKIASIVEAFLSERGRRS